MQLASPEHIQIWELHGFKRLEKIRLDWLFQVIMPHSDFESEIPVDRLPFKHVPSTVTELDIRGLPWPSPLIFYGVSVILPNLEVLRLRQHEIWCSLCHTCSVVKFQAPGPEKITYDGGLGLPVFCPPSGANERRFNCCIDALCKGILLTAAAAYCLHNYR